MCDFVETITIREFANLLGISRQTVYNRAYKGEYQDFMISSVEDGKQILKFDISILTEEQKKRYWQSKAAKEEKLNGQQKSIDCEENEEKDGKTASESTKNTDLDCKDCQTDENSDNLNGKSAENGKTIEYYELLIRELRNRIDDKDDTIYNMRKQLDKMTDLCAASQVTINRLQAYKLGGEDNPSVIYAEGKTETPEQQAAPERAQTVPAPEQGQNTEQPEKPDQKEEQQDKLTWWGHIKKGLNMLFTE